MSLDVGLAERMVTQPYPTMRLSFDDDGYYWFCYPFFEELAQRTGQMIDLFDGAWFSDAKLDDLLRTLNQIVERAREMPGVWEQCVGHSMGSHIAPTPPVPIYKPVSRDDLLPLVTQFIELVNEAKHGGFWIACLGD